MFLGFVLAAVSIKTSTKSGTAVAMLVPVMALGLPIMDTLLAMVRRTVLGRPMFSADKEHIHHRMMSRLVLSHRSAVLVLYGLCALFTLTALGLHWANTAQSAMLLTGMAVVVAVLMRKLGYLDLRRAGGVGEAAAQEHPAALAGEGRDGRGARGAPRRRTSGPRCARWPRRWTPRG